MFATRSELLEKIGLGEDSFLELKEVHFAGAKIRGPEQNDLADELAAFANGSGGVLLLGVHDKTREVLGIPLERLDDVEALVRQACADSIDPPCVATIERISLPDNVGVEQPVIRVGVPRSLFVHQSPGGYYRRVGSSRRQLPSGELARLFQQRSQTRLIRFDESSVSWAGMADLDENLWRRFVTPHSDDAPELFLSKLGMAAQDEKGVWRPTVAGLLMACRNPEAFMSTAFIQAVAYRGTSVASRGVSSYQLDARDLTGPLDEQIMDACHFVRKNMRVAARKSGMGGRQDLPQYDMAAVFEAVTNAVAHRDYSVTGSKVRLRVFADRLELYAPGMLANGMTPESLPFRQAARNEAVASLLARCRIEREDLIDHRTYIMDKRGEGVPLILSRSEALSGRLPEYRLIAEMELMLTIWAADV